MKLIAGYIFYLGSIVAAVLLHFWTIYWVYDLKGMIWAFISFISPPFAELIMTGVSISSAGWNNQYLLSWVGIGIFFKLGELILAHIPENSNAN